MDITYATPKLETADKSDVLVEGRVYYNFFTCSTEVKSLFCHVKHVDQFLVKE